MPVFVASWEAKSSSREGKSMRLRGFLAFGLIAAITPSTVKITNKLTFPDMALLHSGVVLATWLSCSEAEICLDGPSQQVCKLILVSWKLHKFRV